MMISGSTAGRLTMKLMVTVSNPRVLSKALMRMYLSPCALRQSSSSIITPLASLRSNMGLPHISQ